MILEFQIEGQIQMHRRFTRLSGAVKNWSGTFRNVGKYLKRFFQDEVFQTEGRVIGEPWVSGPYYNKLQRTGIMRNSFIYQSAKDYVLVTNTAPYFKYHQSRLPRKKLPRRIMMKLDERRKQSIIKLFQAELISKANVANL